MNDYFRTARKYAQGGSVYRDGINIAPDSVLDSALRKIERSGRPRQGEATANAVLTPDEQKALNEYNMSSLERAEAKRRDRGRTGLVFPDMDAEGEFWRAPSTQGEPPLAPELVMPERRGHLPRLSVEPGAPLPPVKYARGGSVAAPKFATKVAKLTSGGLDGALPGRSDKLGIGAKPGAFVMPADVVSAVGQGNSKAGMKVLDGMFKSGPYGSHLPRGGARSAVPRRGKPAAYADGGIVPIAVSHGEYIIEPEEIVAQFGDIETGHAALEQFAKDQRQDYIKTLRSLPGPRRG